LNLRVEGALLGHSPAANSDSGLGGVGMSLRYRPTPGFAFDFGADVLAGNDYNGFARTETPVSLSSIVYLNPKSRVQLYLLGGAHYSHAEVRSDVASYLLQPIGGGQFGASYDYVGGQGGGGLELRFGPHFSMSFDVLGFVRSRVGDLAKPEFEDYSTGRTSNTSGGALVRGGMTFWW
jgi:hypothetical protein